MALTLETLNGVPVMTTDNNGTPIDDMTQVGGDYLAQLAIAVRANRGTVVILKDDGTVSAYHPSADSNAARGTALATAVAAAGATDLVLVQAPGTYEMATAITPAAGTLNLHLPAGVIVRSSTLTSGVVTDGGATKVVNVSGFGDIICDTETSGSPTILMNGSGSSLNLQARRVQNTEDANANPAFKIGANNFTGRIQVWDRITSAAYDGIWLLKGTGQDLAVWCPFFDCADNCFEIGEGGQSTSARVTIYMHHMRSMSIGQPSGVSGYPITAAGDCDGSVVTVYGAYAERTNPTENGILTGYYNMPGIRHLGTNGEFHFHIDKIKGYVDCKTGATYNFYDTHIDGTIGEGDGTEHSVLSMGGGTVNLFGRCHLEQESEMEIAVTSENGSITGTGTLNVYGSSELTPHDTVVNNGTPTTLPALDSNVTVQGVGRLTVGGVVEHNGDRSPIKAFRAIVQLDTGDAETSVGLTPNGAIVKAAIRVETAIAGLDSADHHVKLGVSGTTDKYCDASQGGAATSIAKNKKDTYVSPLSNTTESSALILTIDGGSDNTPSAGAVEVEVWYIDATDLPDG